MESIEKSNGKLNKEKGTIQPNTQIIILFYKNLSYSNGYDFQNKKNQIIVNQLKNKKSK